MVKEDFEIKHREMIAGSRDDIKSEKVVDSVPEDSPEEVPKVKSYSKSELYAMGKEEQSKLIESLTTEKVPSKEKDRVELILKLQA